MPAEDDDTQVRRLGPLDWIEAVGNRLPDPVVLFLIALCLTWSASWWLAPFTFAEIDPKTNKPIVVHDQLTLKSMTVFMKDMVKNFVEFPPLGLVLVALLGVAVAEHSGLINACVRGALAITPRRLVTPMLLLVAILSHSAGDTGFILVIPLGGVIFRAVGRHPLAGIACAFAGVSGGFSANFLPSSLDTLLQGITQPAAQILQKNAVVNPLCNWWFMSSSAVLIIAVGWFVTERIVEPRVSRVPVTGEESEMPGLLPLSRVEFAGLAAAAIVLLTSLALLIVVAWPATSPLRNLQGSLTGSGAPLMSMIVPLLFFFFALPGIAYGVVAGTIRSDRDVVQGMSKSMSSMGYYLVMAFFAAQFIAAFRESNVGALLSLKGATFLAGLKLSGVVVLLGVVLLTTLLDLIIGSASAKWAVMAPVLVPMLMSLGISPEWTQAAFRVGASCANVVTPLMPYFPLAVLYCRRYVPTTGVGTLAAMMAPYSATFLLSWTILLMVYWFADWPLGIT